MGPNPGRLRATCQRWKRVDAREQRDKACPNGLLYSNLKQKRDKAKSDSCFSFLLLNKNSYGYYATQVWKTKFLFLDKIVSIESGVWFYSFCLKVNFLLHRYLRDVCFQIFNLLKFYHYYKNFLSLFFHQFLIIFFTFSIIFLFFSLNFLSTLIFKILTTLKF